MTTRAMPSTSTSHHLRIRGATPVSMKPTTTTLSRAGGVSIAQACRTGVIVPRTARPAAVASPAVLRIVLPKGSLESATLDLFAAADLAVVRSSAIEYRASIDDPRVDEVRILRPQEIPVYVAEGLFDLGITGRDWIEETGSDVVSLGELRYSKATTNPVKVVVAVAEGSPARSVADLPQGVRVSSEYPELTRRFFAER